MFKKSTVYTYKIHKKFPIKLIIMIIDVERRVGLRNEIKID